MSDEESVQHFQPLLDRVPERPTLATLIRKHGVEDLEFPALEPGAVLLKEYLVAGPED
ncbi:Uncharacterised protein [Mycobacteroides abscessus subsp. abscessus]|nr:Uncharacterised protein [Mycobacteroides abscessus subsp. abscessus]